MKEEKGCCIFDKCKVRCGGARLQDGTGNQKEAKSAMEIDIEWGDRSEEKTKMMKCHERKMCERLEEPEMDADRQADR